MSTMMSEMREVSSSKQASMRTACLLQGVVNLLFTAPHFRIYLLSVTGKHFSFIE